MARTKKKETTALVVTRAEKKDATKQLVKELLAEKPLKHSELIDNVANLYVERFGGEETENINDVKGRVGSVLDIMKKESEVGYEGGMYALKARTVEILPEKSVEEKPAKKPKKTTKKAEKTETKPAPKTTKKEKTSEAVTEEKTDAPAPKKRGRKPKTEEKTDAETEIAPIGTPMETMKSEEPVEPKAEEVKAVPVQTEETQPIAKEEVEETKKNVVMDMSFLFGGTKPEKTLPEKEVLPAKIKEPIKTEEKPVKAEEKPAKTAEKPVKQEKEAKPNARKVAKGTLKVEKKSAPLSADERLKEAYLKRIRSLGGDYFEYYSVYLLERYSMKNGRRLESMKISGGDHDGGIDGEIELTDKLGFRETIYIQSKNWDPEKGNERLWVVGETLLQQFIGACAYRQATEKKQHCRGIFITTSRFTPEAKRILAAMSDKIVGYDGDDLYEAAKECSFGLIEKSGNWVLDEKLLSGTKAFFNLG